MILYNSVYHFLAVRAHTGPESASFLSVLTQGETHVISCISLVLPYHLPIIWLAGERA